MPKSRAVPEKDSEVTLQAQFTGYEFPCTLAFLIKLAIMVCKSCVLRTFLQSRKFNTCELFEISVSYDIHPCLRVTIVSRNNQIQAPAKAVLYMVLYICSSRKQRVDRSRHVNMKDWKKM